MSRISLFLGLAAALGLAACEGPAGQAGSSCSVKDNGDGTSTITCKDGTSATVKNGAEGAPGTAGTPGGEGKQGPEGIQGPEGKPAPGYVALEPAGLVGAVSDAAGAKLSAGTVYLVPSADVAALPATTVATDSTNDEPLEDVIAAKGATYLKATVSAEGLYAIKTVAAGSYFLVFMPDAADKGHLPGGSGCRIARASTELVGKRIDLRVSSAAPANATYVGSGKCVTCHGRAHIGSTLHRLGLWSPYELGVLQNVNARKADLYAGMAKFTGTKVWFYDFDTGRGFDKYKTSLTDPRIATPAAVVSLTVTLQQINGVYSMLLENVATPSDPPRTYKVDFVYGGGLYKQRYVTKVVNGNGFFHAMLPVQFQHEGNEGAVYGRTSKTFRDYHADYYFDEATKLLKDQVPSKSFEKNCVSCHAVGAKVSGSDATTWTATTISDPMWGDFDFDGDGIKDEMNVGCETCHGPGSEHWNAAGQGKHIVSPGLLTPSRSAMICGQCHSRPKGALGTDSPVNADGLMMIAGTSRATFLTNYATKQLDGATSDYHADAKKHSKAHHQQYSDFIRSKMYKNGGRLMVCSDCHELHSRPNKHQLIADPTDNAASCGGTCHGTQAANVAAHVDAKLGAGMGSLMATAKCVECHMAKTAKTGAGRPGISAGGQQYWQNDISSHLFDVPDKADSKKTPGVDMPTPYTNTCAGSCHAAGP